MKTTPYNPYPVEPGGKAKGWTGKFEDGRKMLVFAFEDQEKIEVFIYGKPDIGADGEEFQTELIFAISAEAAHTLTMMLCKALDYYVQKGAQE